MESYLKFMYFLAYLFIYLFINLLLPSNIDARGVRVGSLFSDEASLFSNLLTSKKGCYYF